LQQWRLMGSSVTVKNSDCESGTVNGMNVL
jgi:hypothetical protein